MQKKNERYNPMKQLAKEAIAQPLEMAAPLTSGEKQLIIGIPKETTYQENRTPLTPSAVSYLTGNGHVIYIETGAGAASNFSDIEFSEAGATIVQNKQDVFHSDIIIKIDPPTLTEIELMHPGQIIFSALQLKSMCQIALNKLIQKKIYAIGYELVQDESGSYPIVRAMSEIAGHASILVGAEYLNNSNIGKGELLGGFTGIPPTQVVIIGAGAVGEYACRAALGLGAIVKVFDNELYRLRRLQENIGQRVFTATLNPKIIGNALRSCDLAIGALRPQNGITPQVVTEEMVASMKPKSVIIDIAIDYGGVFATSELTNHEKPIFRKHEVIHYCVPNVASRISRTASYAISNIFTPILSDFAHFRSFEEYIKTRQGARKGVYCFKGHLTNKVIAQKFGLKYKEIDFLIGSFSD
jgi:alanine dehydrogenase